MRSPQRSSSHFASSALLRSARSMRASSSRQAAVPSASCRLLRTAELSSSTPATSSMASPLRAMSAPHPSSSHPGGVP
eukprot:5505125-Prymnesium_polylepis.1